MSEPSARQTMPNIAIVQGFTKLGVAHISTWKTNLQDYLDAVGLGKFTQSAQSAPTDPHALEIFRQQRRQAIIILRTTLDPTNEAHIAGISDPYLALESLERRHGVNSGINMANIITEIVNYKYDDSITIAEHVSKLQSLHNRLNQVTARSSNLRLSNELLALFAIINLPREEFGSLVQQLMGDIENLSTETVFNRLITEGQMQSSSSNTVAFSTTTKAQPKPKASQPLKARGTGPNELCHLPRHGSHTNMECRMQRMGGNQSNVTTNHGALLLSDAEKIRRFNHAHAAVATVNPPASSTSLTNDQKAALFDAHMSNAYANHTTSQPPPSSGANVNPSTDAISFSNAYSVLVNGNGSNDVEYILDTAADRHMFKDKTLFQDINSIDPIHITTADGGNSLTSHSAGTVIRTSTDKAGATHTATLTNTLHVPAIAVNLISVIQLCDEGYVLSGNASHMSLIHKNGMQIHAHRKPLSGEMWKISVSLDAPTSQSTNCFVASTDLQHQRMGHLHSAGLQRFCSTSGNLSPCQSCILAKAQRGQFYSHLPRSTRPLYRIHSDVVGPIQVSTPSGNRYFVTFIDECTRFNRVYLMKTKSEVFKRFCQYTEEVERHTGHKICILKSDRGGEYWSSPFLKYLQDRGITLEQGPAKTPQHNSVAERFNRSIMEISQAQMIHAGLPLFLWGEIVMATSHILNLSPTASINTTPQSAWMDVCASGGGHKDDIKFLRVIGCAAFAHIQSSDRQKLDAKACSLIHIGYEPGAKAYRLWDSNTRRVVVSRDVTFHKYSFPMRRQPDPEFNAERWFPIDPNSFPSDPDPSPAPAPPLPASAPSPAEQHPPPTRTARQHQPVSHYGNLRSYAAAVSDSRESDTLHTRKPCEARTPTCGNRRWSPSSTAWSLTV